MRSKEAKALFNAGLFDGAYYIAGYSIECALKACIAKQTRKHDFPDKARANASYTHKLRELIRVAYLEEALAAEIKASSDFEKNWEIVQSWSEESRYEFHSREQALEPIDAISNDRHGVIGWIKLHW